MSYPKIYSYIVAFEDLHVSEFVKTDYLLWRLLAFLYSLLDCQLSRTLGADSGDDRSKVEDVMHSQKPQDVAVEMKWNKSKSAAENELEQY